MTATPKGLYIEQGATFFLGFNWVRAAVDANGNPVLDANGNPTPGEPYDLAGCTARMQFRVKQGAPTLLTATSESPLDTTGNIDPTKVSAGAGRIRLEPDRAAGAAATGRIEIELTDEDTDVLTSKTAVYDLEIEWPLQTGQIRPHVDRLLQGSVTVDPNITQVDNQDAILT